MVPGFPIIPLVWGGSIPPLPQGIKKKQRLIIDKTHQSILDIYRFRLRHYSEKGIGNESDITKTTITKTMVFTCLERYLELGGDLKEVQLNDKIYDEFISEVSMLQ